VGTYVGVFKARVDDDLLTFPAAPSPPYSKPSPIPDFRQTLHPTKAVWRFPNGTSSLSDRRTVTSFRYATVQPSWSFRSRWSLPGALASTGARAGRFPRWRHVVPNVPGLALKDSLNNGRCTRQKESTVSESPWGSTKPVPGATQAESRTMRTAKMPSTAIER